jgi:hypothetical protein
MNGVWTWSFPYEPRYLKIPRQQFIERSFLANYLLDFSVDYLTALIAGAISIPPTPIKGFFFGPAGSERPSVPAVAPATITNAVYNAHDFLWISDANLRVKNEFNNTPTGSANVSDAVKALFGFGDLNNRIYSDIGSAFYGTTHFADTRRRNDDQGSNFGQKWAMSPLIRGWKYGVYSGLPTFSKAYFRQGSYGQVRDMLEQRPFTKFYQTSEKNQGIVNFRLGTTPAAVTVKFVNATGSLVKPDTTTSQNLSFEVTSSFPYFDGETRNR